MSPTISTVKKGAKSSGRQTNNSLSTISGHVLIESASTLKSNDSKQSNSNNASSGKANESKKSIKVSNNSNKNNAKTEKKSARNLPATTPQKASSSSV